MSYSLNQNNMENTIPRELLDDDAWKEFGKVFRESVAEEMVYPSSFFASKRSPADCIDQREADELQEQGIKFNEDSLEICPNYVILTIGSCTLKIGMNRFRKFAEWYLEPQELK